MPKGLFILFIFISVICVWSSILPKTTYAVESGKIGFGPIELDVRDPYPEGQLAVSVNTGAPANYNFVSGNSSGCTRGPEKRGPCIGEQSLSPNPDPSTGNTKLKITVSRLINGRVVQTGPGGDGNIVLTNGNLRQTQEGWETDLSANSTTGQITFSWEPYFGRPSMLVEPDTISQAQSVAVTVNLPNPKSPTYRVLLDNGVILRLACSADGSCNFTKASNVDSVLDNVSYSATDNQLKFNIIGHDLNVERNHSLLVTFPEQPANEIYTKSFFVSNNPATNLEIKFIKNSTEINPLLLELNETQGATINFKLVNGTNENYTATLPYWYNYNQQIISQTFPCSGAGCTSSFRLNNQGLESGDVVLTVTNGKGRIGKATIKVAAPPASTGTGGGGSGGAGGTAQNCPANQTCTTSSGGLRCDNGNGISTAIGCVPTDPQVLIQNLFRIAIGAGGAIALLLMVGGAFTMITSAGNPDAVKKGHEAFTSAIIGLLIVVSSVLLLQIIGVDILQIPGFGK